MRRIGFWLRFVEAARAGFASLSARPVLMVVRVVLFAAAISGGATIDASAAGDAQTLNVQQLLSALDYSPGDMNGIASAKTTAAIKAFLVDSGADPSLRGPELVDLLHQKIAERVQRGREKLSSPSILSPTAITDPDFIALLPDLNLIVAGNCGDKHFFRLDDLRPTGGATSRGCQRVVAVSPSREAYVESYTDSLALRDVPSDLLTDFVNAHEEEIDPGFGGIADDDRTAAFGQGRQVFVLDLATKAKRLLGSHRARVRIDSVRISANGAIATSAAVPDDYGKRSEVILWDVAKGRKLRTYVADAAVPSPDGSLIALLLQPAASANIEIRAVNDDHVVATLDTKGSLPCDDCYRPDFNYLTFLPDNKTLAYLWNPLPKYPASEPLEHDGKLVTWAIGDSSQKVVADDAINPHAFTISPKTGQAYWAKPTGIVRADIATGAVTDAASGSLASAKPFAGGLSPDGGTFAVAFGQGTGLSIALMDPSTGAVTKVLSAGKLNDTLMYDDRRHLAFMPDSRRILTNAGGDLQVVDTATNAARTLLASDGLDHADAFAISQSGDRVAVLQKGVISVLDGTTFDTIKTIKTHGQSLRGSSGSNALAFIDGDRKLLFAGLHLESFDLPNYRQTFDLEMRFPVGNGYLPAGGNYIIPVERGGDTYWIGNEVFGTGNVLLFGGGKVIRQYANYRPGAYKSAVSLGGGRYLGASFSEVVLTDIDAKKIDTVVTHAGGVVSLDLRANGDLISVGTEGEVRVTDIAGKREIARTRLFADGSWMALTPEGFFAGDTRAASQMFVRSGLVDVRPVDAFFNALYRPDLVQAKLGGDADGKVEAAADKLGLATVIQSGPPPLIRIDSPAPSATVDADTVNVEASLTDQGGGIGKVEWRVNGVTLGIDARGFDRLAAGDAAPVNGQTITVQQTLSLDPGNNTIEALAYNAKGLVASTPVSVTVKWEGESTNAPPKLHVVAIGVNDYWDSRLRLTYAAPDAEAIAAAFQKTGSSLYSAVDVTTVLDADVTAAHLDQVFADLSTKIRPRDVFVMFVAGHGKTQDGRYYFLPQDFRYEDDSSIAKGGIDQDRFQAWLAKIPARKSVLLYDTCDSGSLTASGLATRGLEQVAALERMTRAMGRTVLSASTDDAPALEGYKGHGVFTYAVLDALGDADANKDGLIEVTELAGAIDRNVPDISYAAFKLRQVPQMSLVGSDFPLANQLAVLDASANTAPIPAEPTHVLIAAADVRDAAGTTGAPITTLPVGTLVRVISTADGWTLIARDGVALGYVAETSLVRLQ